MSNAHTQAKEAKTLPERLKTIVEIAAVIGVGVFFAWRFATGWLDVNTDVEITSSRTHASQQEDYLAVTVGLYRGDYGSLKLGDSQVRVTYFDQGVSPPPPVKLISTDRLMSVGGKLDWNQMDKDRPLLHLHAHEKSQFAAVLKVPRDSVCILEVVFLFHRNFDGSANVWGQRRSSAISFPLKDEVAKPQ